MNVHPSFGEPQTIIAIAFGLIVIPIVVTFALVARQSRREVEFEKVRDTGYAIRRFWLAFLVVLLGAGVVVSLFFLPYSSDAATQTVNVTGGQFYWSISPDKFDAGSTVEFDVTSADVNHGFGIYDPAGRLIGSTQAMPGFHNHLEITLDDPGTYMISCLELCGFKHHDMTRTFEVVGE